VVKSSIAGENIYKNINEKNCTIPSKLVPKCPVCNGPMEPNIRKDEYFVEDENWRKMVYNYNSFLKNIPKDKREIGNGEKVGFEIRNSWGVKRYKGPRPPFGTHKYYFRLYALSEESLYARNIKELREEIRKYKLGETYIMGKFTKVRRIDKKRKGWH